MMKFQKPYPSSRFHSSFYVLFRHHDGTSTDDTERGVLDRITEVITYKPSSEVMPRLTKMRIIPRNKRNVELIKTWYESYTYDGRNVGLREVMKLRHLNGLQFLKKHGTKADKQTLFRFLH